MAEFWWKGSKDKRGMHWKAWEALSKSKKEGGLGFKDIEAFNLALLGKQLWRMLTLKNSLLAKVFKARYFQDSNPLNATLGSRPSYAWRSIYQAKEMISKGARMIIGNGRDTSLWDNLWIEAKPAHPLRATNILSPQQQEVLSNLSSVSDLLVDDGRQWNQNLISEMFGREQCMKISKIRPGGNQSRDGYSWDFTRTGCYSVKSGYWTILNMRKGQEELECYNQPSLEALFSMAWNAEASSKIQHFLWKCLSNCLPVAGNLSQRHLCKDGYCGRCNVGIETVNHLFFTCPYARLIWAVSPIPAPPSGDMTDSFFENFHYVMSCKPAHPHEEYKGKLSPWLLWRIWKNRNDYLIRNVDYDALVTVEKALADMEEWTDCNKEKKTIEKNTDEDRRQTKWTKPPEGWVKCNVDGSWSHTTDHSGVGWILRDHKGEEIWLGAKKISKAQSSLETEAEALRWALLCLKRFRYRKIIIETDAQCLVNAIRREEEWPAINAILMESFDDLKLCFIRREGNMVADRIAKDTSSFENFVPKLYSIVPTWLNPLTEDEKL